MWAVVRTAQSLNAVSPYPLALNPVALSALLGGILWVISDELDRIRKRDLAPMDVYGWIFRLLVAIPFGFAFAAIMKDDVGIPRFSFWNIPDQKSTHRGPQNWSTKIRPRRPAI